MTLLRHHKVCSKFQGELAITESDEDFKRYDKYICTYVCAKLTGDQFVQGWPQSFTESPSVGGGFALQMFTRSKRKMGFNTIICVSFRKVSGWTTKQERFRLIKYPGTPSLSQLDMKVRSQFKTMLKCCYSAENCSGYYSAEIQFAYDLDCTSPHTTICQVLFCFSLALNTRC